MGRREAFDPLRSYVANRDFRWGGVLIEAGQPFNDRRDMRRFRQLYDTRYLAMTDVEPDAGALAFTKMSDAELRQWLIDRGMPNLAHPRSTRQRLIDRCQRVWMADQKEAGDGVTAGELHPQGGGEGVQGPPPVRNTPAAGAVRRERFG